MKTIAFLLLWAVAAASEPLPAAPEPLLDLPRNNPSDEDAEAVLAPPAKPPAKSPAKPSVKPPAVGSAAEDKPLPTGHCAFAADQPVRRCELVLDKAWEGLPVTLHIWHRGEVIGTVWAECPKVSGYAFVVMAVCSAGPSTGSSATT